jgi:hypothetical protein
LQYVARTQYNLGLLDSKENQIADARAHYQQAMEIFRRLASGDGRYENDVQRVDASLKELGPAIPEQHPNGQPK